MLFTWSWRKASWKWSTCSGNDQPAWRSAKGWTGMNGTAFWWGSTSTGRNWSPGWTINKKRPRLKSWNTWSITECPRNWRLSSLLVVIYNDTFRVFKFFNGKMNFKTLIKRNIMPLFSMNIKILEIFYELIHHRIYFLNFQNINREIFIQRYYLNDCTQNIIRIWLTIIGIYLLISKIKWWNYFPYYNSELRDFSLGLSSEERLHGVKYIIESFVGCIRDMVLSSGKSASDLLPIQPLIATKHENVREGCIDK